MSTYCKYYKQQKQVSYDSGQTWSNVVPKEYQVGAFYGESIDCQDESILTRWVLVPGAFLCVEGDKYEKEIAEYSVDGGNTFNSYYPAVYRVGRKLESNSEICHNKWEGYYYLNTDCPAGYRWIDGRGCVYLGGGGGTGGGGRPWRIDPVKYVRCSTTTSTTLTQSEVNYSPYILYEGFIGDCVTSIGDSAFQNSTSLSSITIPDSVTSIGEKAFQWCDSLSSITIPDSVTSIGSQAFYGCTSLTSITVEATTPPTLYDTSVFSSTNSCPIYVPCESVNIYKYTSGWRTYEARIDGIPPCDIPPVPQLKLYASYTGGTTYGIACNSSTTLTQSEVRENSVSYRTMVMATVGDCVTTIDTSAFTQCYDLTSVFIGSGVTSIGEAAFQVCSGLTSIDVPSGVTSIGERAFASCRSLTSIDIPDNVTSIGNRTFEYCYGLTSATIGNGVTSISNGTFQECDNLTTCTIGSGVTSIGQNAFSSCYSLSSIDIPDNVTSIDALAFYNCSGMTSCTIGNGVTTIGGNAFYGCTSLTSVTIGSGITSIGGWAFGNCSGLTSITVEATTPPTLYDTSVFGNTNNCPIYVPCDSIYVYRSAQYWSSYASRILGIPPCEASPFKFKSTYTGGTSYSAVCESSTSTLNTGDTKPSGYDYTAMTSAEIGDCVTTINSDAFSGCTSLSSVTIPDSVTVINNHAFENCISLSSVTIPDSVTSIGWYTFRYCSGLTSVSIGSGVTSIDTYAFAGCRSLSSIVIPDNVTIIDNYAFQNCSGLTYITIPDSVTSINYSVFYNCTSLTSVTIGSGITSIGGYAFAGCTGLTSITVEATTPPTFGYNAFNNTNNFTIYVPCESLDTYKSASGWSSYASRIYGIPPCTIYRWINLDPSTDYYCSGTTKYYKQQKQVSYDSEHTWSNVVPAEYQQGGIAEEQSIDCGYSVKLRATYSGGTSYAKACNSTTTLSSGDTKPTGYSYKNMESADVGNCVTEIGSTAFSGHTSLSSCTIGSGVTSIGMYAFDGCSSLSSITIPDSVTSIGYGAFEYCGSLTSCTIGSGVTSIGTSAFRSCSSLTSISIPSGVTSIGNYAFQSCTSLSSITIPDSVTSIGQQAFQSCGSLTSCTIGSGVTSVGRYAFSGCTSLSSVTILADTPPTFGGNAFGYDPNRIFYVPCGSVNAYKAVISTNIGKVYGIPPCE